MGSGRKEMFINTQERAISTDVNRLQKFASASEAEFFRYMMNVTGNDDIDAGSVITEFTTLGTPLRAEIINGLLVRPQSGVLDLFVDPGVLMALAPDAAADDSNYKFVKDPGVSALGLLAMTANPAGSIRVDIIEVQVGSAVSETDNRDIYNPVTGLFTATSVTKARQANVGGPAGSAGGNIRVRAGVAGAGIPALAAGWLPLAIASVAAATVNNDTITFWDVRPLISDRPFGMSALALAKPEIRKSIINAATALATTTGIADSVLGSRRVGGRLRRGSPGTDADNIDVTSATNRENGFALVANRPWYIYFCTPFGLPRWARYTDGPAGRVPRSPRGIPLVSMRAPDTDGKPSAALTLPATFFGATQTVLTTEAMAVAAGYVNNAAGMAGFFGDKDNGFMLSAAGLATDPMEVAGVDNSAAGSGVLTFTLTAGTHYPTNARALLCEFRADITSDNSSAEIHYHVAVRTYGPNGGGILSTALSSLPKRASSALTEVSNALNMWVELAPIYPAVAAPTQVIDVNVTAGGGVLVVTGFLRVLGWKF